MELKERQAIHQYHKYKRRLGKHTSLSSYWVGSFEGNYDQLVVYLKNLKQYINILEKYVKARQYHYTKFIKNKRMEDINHRIWRKNMKLVLSDAKEKYEYYSELEEKQFYEFVTFSTQPNIIIEPDSDSEDSEDSEEIVPIILKPVLTKRDINRRKRLRQKLKKQKAEEEALYLNDQKRLILSKYYKYSLDALYLVRQFFNHGVILIDPDLYMNDN